MLYMSIFDNAYHRRFSLCGNSWTMLSNEIGLHYGTAYKVSLLIPYGSMLQ